MPFGAGLATGLSIGEQVGATAREAPWIAASYPYLSLSPIFLLSG